MESDYQDKQGVLDVVSGFTGGTLENPTYKGNHEGHFEATLIMAKCSSKYDQKNHKMVGEDEQASLAK